jgi:APA family basic amino acid/polyamine antiporter
MMMGIVIGSGIFLTTGIMAQAIPSAFLILLAWLVGGLLILTGILFWALAAASIFTLRKKYPDLPRAYKAWVYPAVPWIFIIALSGILLSTLIRRPVESLAGVGLMAIGIPVCYIWKKRRG